MTHPHLPIDLVHHAIATGIFGQIQWDDRADERARSTPDLQGLTPAGIRRLLHDFVAGGGRLDERRESRPTWIEANVDRPTYYRDLWYRAVVLLRGACSMTTLQDPWTTTIEHDGRAYRVEVLALTAPQCANCQAISIDDEADRQISAAFRREARLLLPEEVRLGQEG